MSPQAVGQPSKVLLTMTSNAVANLFRSATMWLIVLFLPPLLARVLDRAAYGVWLLLLQLAAYITALDWGVQAAIARYVARAEEIGDRRALARLLGSVEALLLIAAGILLLVAALASWQLTAIFPEIPPEIAPAARRALFAVAASLAVALPFSVLAGFFLGLQKNAVTAFCTSAGRVLGAAGSAWAAWHHRGLFAMALWVGIGNLLQCLLYIFFWSREGRRQPVRPSHADRATAREFICFSFAMLVSQFSFILITGLDMPIVAAFDFRAAAYYGVASALAYVLTVPHGALVNTLMPVAAGISAGGDPPRLGGVLLKTTRFSTALLCLIAFPLLLLMPLLLRLWVGQEYALHALLFAQILVVAQLVRLTLLPYAMIAFAAGQQQRTLASPIVEGVVNLLCSLALVRLMGARGVALGTLAGAIAGVWLHFAISLPRTDCVQVGRAQLLSDGIVKPLSYALPLALAGMIGFRHFSSPLLQLALAAAAEFGLLALFWNFTFGVAERAQLRGVLGHWLARISRCGEDGIAVRR